MATIEVNMAPCSKYVRVTATPDDEGNFDIKVESDCDALRHYSETLKKVTFEDISNFETSVINKESVRGPMSMICLAPIAVYQAAWMEAGMMSKKIYRKCGPCTMIDLPDKK